MLIYGSESWVATGAMLKVIYGLHYWTSRRIAGKTSQNKVGRYWKWPPVADKIEIAGIWKIKEHTQRRQHAIVV